MFAYNNAAVFGLAINVSHVLNPKLKTVLIERDKRYYSKIKNDIIAPCFDDINRHRADSSNQTANHTTNKVSSNIVIHVACYKEM